MRLSRSALSLSLFAACLAAVSVRGEQGNGGKPSTDYGGGKDGGAGGNQGGQQQGGQVPLGLAIRPQPSYPSQFQMDLFTELNLNFADTGLSPELISNRAFQTAADAEFNRGTDENIGTGSLARWLPVDKSDLKLVKDKPLSDALPQSVVISPTENGAGVYGIKNTGFFGIPVHKGWEYAVSFWIRADTAFDASVQVGLFSFDTSHSFGSNNVDVKITTEWQNVKTTVSASEEAPDLNNVFAIILDGTKYSQPIQVNLVSVFQPTWEGTAIRADTAKAFANFAPKAVRFPGGNYMRGVSAKSRFQWRNTIGPMQNRPGRLGIWNGWITDSLGVIEMYNFITKLNANIIVGLWAGSDGLDKVVAPADMGPYVKEQTDFLHFLLDTEGELADLRVKSGGPKDPYPVSAVMVGNESPGTADNYEGRFELIYNAIKNEFPHAKFDVIATSPVTVEKGAVNFLDTLNTPRYGTPQDFLGFYNEYDNADRNNTIHYNLEFGVINDGNSPSGNLWGGPGRLQHCILGGSLAETVFILGLEKNGDIVRGAAAAPELANAADPRAIQSGPGQLEFDSDTVVKSSSFLMQQGVSKYAIANVHKATETGDLKAANVYYSIGSNTDDHVIVKLVNYDKVEKSININIGRKVDGIEQYLVTGPGPMASNTLDSPKNIQASTQSVTASPNADGSVTLTLPAWSFNVFALH